MSLLLLLAACYDCGTYEIQTGVWFDQTMGDLYDGDPTELDPSPEDPDDGFDFVPLDGEYHEQCGKEWGSWGLWDRYADGKAWVMLTTASPDFDEDINSIPIDLYLLLPIGAWEVGQQFGLDVLGGYAELTDMGGNHWMSAPLVEATVRVTSGALSDDPCTEDEGYAGSVGPTFGLSWDLKWDDSLGHTYAAQGEDEVFFDTFQSAACP